MVYANCEKYFRALALTLVNGFAMILLMAGAHNGMGTELINLVVLAELGAAIVWYIAVFKRSKVWFTIGILILLPSFWICLHMRQ